MTIDALGHFLARANTAQWDGMGDIWLVRYESALVPPCPATRVVVAVTNREILLENEREVKSVHPFIYCCSGSSRGLKFLNDGSRPHNTVQ